MVWKTRQTDRQSLTGEVLPPCLLLTSSSVTGFSPEDNHLRGGYGVTGGVGRARKLALRRTRGLDDIGG
ncbi:jg19752 [Pararge aegeria aegeria]|uniref:Jg19752 protein n=1 Tax=Pararge aegeria aegeria TaxID=348720 RepID=A0A8S4R1G1_9NEOP|nr:jg19752 [Pararge aegeria aegeria]